jgi:hypothetical protein
VLGWLRRTRGAALIGIVAFPVLAAVAIVTEVQPNTENALPIYSALTFVGCLVVLIIDVLRASSPPRTPAPRARVHR